MIVAEYVETKARVDTVRLGRAGLLLRASAVGLDGANLNALLTAYDANRAVILFGVTHPSADLIVAAAEEAGAVAVATPRKPSGDVEVDDVDHRLDPKS